jgi:hypothetical protein
MFDRSRTINNAERIRRAVVINLLDGGTLKGTLAMWTGHKLADVLNGTEEFLDFQTHEGEAFLLAKRAVAMVRGIEVEKATQLQQRVREISLLDPFAVLGIERGASQEAIKTAYHELVRTYHPDRFATLALPKEMNDYAGAMLTRINLAYEQLSA